MKRILIVDDEEDVRASFKRFLEKEKYDVSEAGSGKEALKLMRTTTFDVVILDILMPKMTGIDVAKEMRRNPKMKNQKIIFATVVGDEQSADIQQIGPVAYIVKPFELTELKKALKKTCGGKH